MRINFLCEFCKPTFSQKLENGDRKLLRMWKHGNKVEMLKRERHIIHSFNIHEGDEERAICERRREKIHCSKNSHQHVHAMLSVYIDE